jgi:hypothetical protein
MKGVVTIAGGPGWLGPAETAPKSKFLSLSLSCHFSMNIFSKLFARNKADHSVDSVAQAILAKLPTPSWAGLPLDPPTPMDKLVDAVNRHREWVLKHGLDMKSMEALLPVPRRIVSLALKQLAEAHQASLFVIVGQAAAGHPHIPAGARLELPFVVKGEVPWWLRDSSVDFTSQLKRLCPEL